MPQHTALYMYQAVAQPRFDGVTQSPKLQATEELQPNKFVPYIDYPFPECRGTGSSVRAAPPTGARYTHHDPRWKKKGTGECRCSGMVVCGLAEVE
jgi:hypothetical protein